VGTSGHMQHPFDIPNVKTGQDLISYFEKIVDHLEVNPGSVKFDGINVSFKLVDDPTTATGKDFRMDRGSSEPSSVMGMSAADAYKKWPEGHGMPPAIDELLKIFNEALPQIKPELKALGMWDDPTKYFNTEYMKKGRTNVIEYGEKILALHGVNQFYEKKAQPWRIKKGVGMDRPGLERPIDPETGKPTKHGSTEVSYDPAALQSIIEKVQPIAEQYEVSLVGDVPTEISSEVDFSAVLNEPFTVQMTETESETHSLGEWLSTANNPFNAKVKKRDGKEAWAISKEIYFAVLNGVPLMELLETPEDVKTAINGALFNQGTHDLGMAVKRASTSTKGSLEGHEGIVIRGLDDRPVKVTGDFIVKGAGGAIKDKIKAAKEQGVIAEGDVIEGPWGKNDEYEDARTARYEEEERNARRNPADPMTSEEHEEYMSLYDDDGKKMVAIYPGRFQPMGRHHAEVYKSLLNDPRFDEVYLATSDKVDMSDKGGVPKSPFNFQEKQEIAAGHDVDPSKLVQTKNPYNATEITQNLDPETVVVYFVGCKDMDADPNVCDGDKPRFPRESLGGFTKKGTPRYFRAFDEEEEYQGVENHAYIAVAPHVQIEIDGLGEMSGTTIRKALKDSSPEFFQEIMGFYDPITYEMIRKKLNSEPEGLEEVSQIPLGIFLGLIEEVLNEADKTRMYGSWAAAIPLEEVCGENDSIVYRPSGIHGQGAFSTNGHKKNELLGLAFKELNQDDLYDNYNDPEEIEFSPLGISNVLSRMPKNSNLTKDQNATSSDGGKTWYAQTDLSSRINHHEDANSTIERIGDELHVRTLRDISPGEELTYDYRKAHHPIASFLFNANDMPQGLVDMLVQMDIGKEEELEEISAAGGAAAAVEGAAGPHKKDEEQQGLIREVEDYLYKLLGAIG